MIILTFLIFSILSPIQDLDTGYYYFGTTNYLGTGLVGPEGKEGEWKVYEKVNPEPDPKPSLKSVNKTILLKEFDSKPKYSVSFKNDQPNGPLKEFFEDGQIKTLSNYQHGKIHGEHTEFFENGGIATAGSFHEGEKTGDWKEFYPDGQISKSYSYKLGLLDGLVESYYPDGKIKWFFMNKGGELNGDYAHFNPDGSFLEKGSYRSGALDGEFIQYYPDHSIKFQGEFLSGKQHGLWKSFDENANLVFEGQFENGLANGSLTESLDLLPQYVRKGSVLAGEKEGEWIVINSNGEVVQKEYYQGGKLMSLSDFQIGDQVLPGNKVKNGKGKRVFFDESGNKVAEGRIQSGFRNGVWYHYYPGTNQILSSGKYIRTEKVGLWTFYTIEGDFLDEKDFGTLNNRGGQSITQNNTGNSFNSSIMDQTSRMNSQVYWSQFGIFR